VAGAWPPLALLLVARHRRPVGGRQRAPQRRRRDHPVRDWLKKPSRLIRLAPVTPEDTAEWLIRQWQNATAEALHAIPEWHNEQDRLRFSLHDLRSGNDLSWALWVKGPSIVSMGAIATPEKCHS
jgi:hypothetical protein